MQIAHPILNSFHHLCKICDVYIQDRVLLDGNMQKLLPLHIRTGTTVIIKLSAGRDLQKLYFSRAVCLMA